MYDKNYARFVIEKNGLFFAILTFEREKSIDHLLPELIITIPSERQKHIPLGLSPENHGIPPIWLHCIGIYIRLDWIIPKIESVFDAMWASVFFFKRISATLFVWATSMPNRHKWKTNVYRQMSILWMNISLVIYLFCFSYAIRRNINV